MNVAIVGAGVAGLSCACELVDRGVSVTVYEQSDSLGGSACSWYAGGMLAPWCERENTEQIVVELGQQALPWWQAHVDCARQRGSLVLAMRRDKPELIRYARLTQTHEWLNGDQITRLEPDLINRFEQGLFFPEEGHLDPCQALIQLADYLTRRNTPIQFGQAVAPQDCDADRVIDCRGYAAQDHLTQLRGVKGEMLLLKTTEIQLSRPVRLLHPRYPVYIVPRSGNIFMLGATQIENDERNTIRVLSMLELLSTAYALHPGFGEAEIVEIGTGVRPAFYDNLPGLMRSGKVLYVNGLFRHGFLLGPAMAIQTANAVVNERMFMALDQCEPSCA